ncbi:LysR substrate-binding domain-containing protein [Stutzerimonas frequens]|uniref:LysR substrate-binding domain-containing protein n=2 Tax=Pseudomonadales TaxID=72274 RepID=UPI0037493458
MASLETRLFNRTTRTVSLTAAGRVYVEQVAPALRDLQSNLEAVRSHAAAPSGTLRINAFASAARVALLPLVLEFIRQYPKVHVDLVTEERLIDNVADGFDVGVRAANLVRSDMIGIPLGQRQCYAVVGTPAYIHRHGRPQTPADLLRHCCLRIRLPNGAIFPWHLRDGQVMRIDVTGPLTLILRILADWTPPRDELCLYYPNRHNPSGAFKAFTSLARANLTGKAPSPNAPHSGGAETKPK